uniref:hypothetical protein n=1 Tax=Streptomyces aureocirculatus TaxID=67275 RepID=UPI00055B81F5
VPTGHLELGERPGRFEPGRERLGGGRGRHTERAGRWVPVVTDDLTGPAERVRTDQSASADDEDGDPGADEPGDDSTARPSDTGQDGVPDTSDDSKTCTSGSPAVND